MIVELTYHRYDYLALTGCLRQEHMRDVIALPCSAGR
jgi:hypothetical protein